MAHTKKITIIIPNYNGLHFLAPCIKSLERQDCQDFDLLIIDNGSTDGSPEWLDAQHLPAILLPTNAGFSGAVNIGIRKAATPYVILLNNDTVAEPGYVAALLAAIEASPAIFSVSPMVVQLHDKTLIDDAGDMCSLFGWAFQRGVGRAARHYRRPCHIFSACACAAIYRRETFNQIGFFDEMHFAYLEDIDIGYRAKIAGFYNRYCPKAVVAHVGSGTSGSKYNPFKVRLAARNSIYLNYKNMPLPQLLANALPIAAGMAVKYSFFKKIGFGADYLSGLCEGLRTAKSCQKVAYRPDRLINYFAIEWELIWGAILYLYEFSCRQSAKKLDK